MTSTADIRPQAASRHTWALPRNCAVLAAVSSFLLATLPLVTWYFQRITDQSDEPLGVLALVAATMLLPGLVRNEREALRISVHPLRLAVGTFLLLILQSAAFIHYPLLTGLVAVFVVGLSISLPRGKAGLMVLLGLSLPLVASLDFYAGYPMRLAASELSVWLLRLTGLNVDREGVLLLDGSNLVGMDPPCAGVRMLWTACFTAAVVATRQRFDWTRTLLLLAGAVACVVAGNGLRAAVVFFPESGRVHWPEWMHPGAGLLVHGAVLAAVLALGGGVAGSGHWCQPRGWARRPMVAAMTLLAVFLGLAGASFLLKPSRSADHDTTWPATLDGVPLELLPLSAKEASFARAFPGSLAKFRCGDAEVILRRVNQATRTMHPSSDCLRAAGFTITTKPLHRDADQRVWGCALAERGGETWRVRERYANHAQTRFCTDASAWFWEALLHPDEGPWLAITIMEPMPEDDPMLAKK